MTDGSPDLARGPDNDLVLGEFTDRKTLRFVRDFSHAPETVWATLIDPTQYRVWLWPCTEFDARRDGGFCFDISGQIWRGRITEFEPSRRLNLGGFMRFDLFEHQGGCRLVLILTRPPTGWSPMALAGYHAWLGRLTRLVEGVSDEEAERWASDQWEAVFPAYERLLRTKVADGAQVIYRLHFGENDPAPTADSVTQLDELVLLLKGRPDLNVVIDGFGDDPCSPDESLALCQARVEAASRHLRDAGVAAERIGVGYVLGNYHYMVPRDTEAGRAFNRRIELRPTY
jgi:outer membrane protein OmpA-like peptidoglycan-associated protein